MSFAMIMGAATSRVRARAGRAARQRVAARTAVSPPDRTMVLLLALYACWGSAIPAMKQSRSSCAGNKVRAVEYMLSGELRPGTTVVAALPSTEPPRAFCSQLSLAFTPAGDT